MKRIRQANASGNRSGDFSLNRSPRSVMRSAVARTPELPMGSEFFYEGSSKVLITNVAWGEQVLGMLTNGRFSVFDLKSAMPDQIIPGKALAETLMNAHLFHTMASRDFWNGLSQEDFPHLDRGRFVELLSSGAMQELRANGLRSHFVELVKFGDPSQVFDQTNWASLLSSPNQATPILKINKAKIAKPKVQDGQTIYPPRDEMYLDGGIGMIPLEILMRDRLFEGSEFTSKLAEPGSPLLADLNLSERPGIGMVLDWFLTHASTKFDPTGSDIYITKGKAAEISSLSPQEIQKLYDTASLFFLGLQKMWKETGLNLTGTSVFPIDAKIEMGLESGTFTLLDGLGPDEVRFMPGVYLSKQLIRDLYNAVPGLSDRIKACKNTAKNQNRPWLDVWKQSDDVTVPELQQEVLDLCGEIYVNLARVFVSNGADSEAVQKLDQLNTEAAQIKQNLVNDPKGYEQYFVMAA
jgi:phosphoribosylaminoimidazole-succinocarboxamide synthase